MCGLFPEQVQKLLGPVLKNYGMSSLIEGRMGGAAEVGPSSNSAPIIIHTPGPTIYHHGKGKEWGIVTYAIVGAGACWVGYAVCVQIMPDMVGKLLPVTRGIFDKTTQALSVGILNIKKVLEEKILGLSKQQDELGDKQDETNKNVSHIKSELGEARIDLNLLKGSLGRCEDSLGSIKGLQDYSSRGVKLLIRCIAGFVPDDANVIDDLARYLEEGDGLDPNVGNNELSKTPLTKSSSLSSSSSRRRSRSRRPPSTIQAGSPPPRIQLRPPLTVPSPMGKKNVFPSISPIQSEDDSSTVSHAHALQDIRALLGH